MSLFRPSLFVPLLFVVAACESSTESCDTALTISPRPAVLEPGHSASLAGLITEDCGQPELAESAWSSSASGIVSVDVDGVIEAIQPGTAWIRAEVAARGLRDSIEVTVPGAQVVALLISSDRLLSYIPPGVESNADTVIVVPTGLETNVTARAVLDTGDTVAYAGPVTWSSSAPETVGIDETGALFAEGAGAATITLASPGTTLAPATLPAIATTGYASVDVGFAAVALNDDGDVVGRSSGGAALWSGGSTTMLGEWYPQDLNDAGTIVGSAHYFASNGPAVVWREGVLDTLPTDGCGYGAAFAVNESDVIVGGLNCDGLGAVRWVDGQLDTIGGAYAVGVNEGGALVGGSRVWSTAGETSLDIPGERTPIATGINDGGWVVGSVTWQVGVSGMAGQGIVWNPAGTPTIHQSASSNGFPPYAGAIIKLTDINNEGVAVGAQGFSTASQYVVLRPGLPPIPLSMLTASPPGSAPLLPRLDIDINDAGQIAAGTKLLTPVPF